MYPRCSISTNCKAAGGDKCMGGGWGGVGWFLFISWFQSLFFPDELLFCALISSVIHNTLGTLSVQNRLESIPLGNFSVFLFPFKTQIFQKAHNTVCKVLAQWPLYLISSSTYGKAQANTSQSLFLASISKHSYLGLSFNFWLFPRFWPQVLGLLHFRWPDCFLNSQSPSFNLLLLLFQSP